MTGLAMCVGNGQNTLIYDYLWLFDTDQVEAYL